MEASESKRIALNTSKTESMIVSKNPKAARYKLHSYSLPIKQVDKFKYLDYLLTPDGKCITEIKRRITAAKVTFKRLSSIMTNRNIKMDTKFRIIQTYVWSVLLYGCELWTVTNNTRKRLEAAEIWFVRRILKISWTEMK